MTQFHAPLKFAIVAALTTASLASHAGIGSSLMQTATVKKPGEFEAKAQADIIFNRGGGFNFSPHLSAGLIEHYMDGEIYLGTGTTDFFFGTMVKYNLLPDLEGQIGLALNLGAAYLRDETINSLLLTFGVLASKDVRADFGIVSPYASFQFEGLINDVDNTVPLTLLLGSKWQITQIAPWNLYSEVTVNLNKSFWGIAVGAGYPF